tara:strand:- start:451 stop:558 length:108 start_codon:yes stop_codon:yes gene_type:complete
MENYRRSDYEMEKYKQIYEIISRKICNFRGGILNG